MQRCWILERHETIQTFPFHMINGNGLVVGGAWKLPFDMQTVKWVLFPLVGVLYLIFLFAYLLAYKISLGTKYWQHLTLWQKIDGKDWIDTTFGTHFRSYVMREGYFFCVCRNDFRTCSKRKHMQNGYICHSPQLFICKDTMFKTLAWLNGWNGCSALVFM